MIKQWACKVLSITVRHSIDAMYDIRKIHVTLLLVTFVESHILVTFSPYTGQSWDYHDILYHDLQEKKLLFVDVEWVQGKLCGVIDDPCLISNCGLSAGVRALMTHYANMKFGIWLFIYDSILSSLLVTTSSRSHIVILLPTSWSANNILRNFTKMDGV